MNLKNRNWISGVAASLMAFISSHTASATPPPEAQTDQDSATFAAPLIPSDPQISKPMQNYIPRRGLGTRVDVARLIRERYKSLPEGVRAVTPITRAASVTGEVEIPVMMFKYRNTGADPFPSENMQNALFDDPAPARTVTTHYDEMSGGLFTLTGEVYDWVELKYDDSYYEDKDMNNCRRNCGDNGDAFIETIQQNDRLIDFTRFDNDGPDNIPNSGDDDGFVDFPAFVHAEFGGECGPISRSQSNTNIWSHKWAMKYWMNNADGYETNDRGHSGANIRIDDYVVMPALSCDRRSMNSIGVFSHEFGHAFKLPDLYDTGSGKSSGIGGWGLMASGSWGGMGGGRPDSPSHMTAWSKQYLGWVIPREISQDTKNVVIQPYVDSQDVVLVDYTNEFDPYDDSYLLLEYREQTGFDSTLPTSGLLVTQINNTRIAAGLINNQVNGVQHDQGVDVMEADGKHDLTYSRNRGDAGDVFLGSTGTSQQTGRSVEPIKAALCNIRERGNSVVLDIYVSRNSCPSGASESNSNGQLEKQSSAPEGNGLSNIIEDMLKGK